MTHSMDNSTYMWSATWHKFFASGLMRPLGPHANVRGVLQLDGGVERQKVARAACCYPMLCFRRGFSIV